MGHIHMYLRFNFYNFVHLFDILSQTTTTYIYALDSLAFLADN